MSTDKLENLEKSSNAFVDAMKEIENEQEEYWDSLTKEQQLMAFCSVVRRIHKAEIVDGRSYRGSLYSVFEFGPDAYAVAQMAGYLDIHNMIHDANSIQKILTDFCKQYNIEIDKEKIDKFIFEQHY